jgi:tryptophan synthase alpha chain
MNRIDSTFLELKKQKRAALMPYLPLGYPSIEKSQELLGTVAQAGADLLELGVPFSDPLADGPINQAAMHRALKNGMTLARCLAMVRQARESGVAIPLTLMGYYNPIVRFGIERFAREAHLAGVDGLIVPDLPPEEAAPLDGACREYDLDVIFLAAPTSTGERLAKIAEATRGFIYLVSVVGVTGAREQLAEDLPGFVSRVRRLTTKPACVGFGIANAESARQVARIADGVIVGSALVSRLGDERTAATEAGEFVAELRGALQN